MRIKIDKVKINSFCVSVLICANPVAWFFSFIPNVLVLILFLACSVCLFVNRSVSKLVLILGAVVVLLFLYCILFDLENEELLFYFFSFLVLGMSGLILSCVEFSYYLIYRNIVLFSFCLIPLLFTMNMGDPEYESVDYGHWMGISYGILRVVNALILFLLLYEISAKKRTFILIALLFYLNFYISYASRGAILSVIILFLLLFLIKKDYPLQKVVIFFCGGVLTLFIILLNIEKLVILLSEILSEMNIHIMFLDKTLRMYMTDSVSNGRDELFVEAWEGFLNSPFFGNGIASFEVKYNRYVHNVFMQVLYEGGIIACIPLMFVFFYSLWFILDRRNRLEARVFLLYIFASGVVELLFSSVYWRSQIFWFYIGYVLILISKKQKLNKLNKLNLK